VAYDSSRFRGEAVHSREPDDDDGFRESPGFRDSVAYREDMQLGAPEPRHGYGDYSFGDYRTDETSYEPGPPTDYDEPPQSAPVTSPRDRLAVHFGWELVLALTVGALGYMLYRSDSGALRGANLENLLISATVLGFVAVGMALSLRAAVPHLALGPLAYAASVFFAENSERGLLVTAGVTGLIAAAAGTAIAVLVTVFRVPAWAASLGAGFGLVLWIQLHRNAVDVVDGAYLPTDHSQLWFAAFVAVSLAGGALGLMPRLRAAVGRYRPTGDAADRGAGGAVAGALALVGSSVLAAVAGVLQALHDREVSPTENGLALTGLALGAALLGGTSVFGRHGGLFGTVLTVVGMTLVVKYADAEGWIVHSLGLAAAAIGVGLIVSRVVEAFGRDRSNVIASAYSGPHSARHGSDSWSRGNGVGAHGGGAPGWSGDERWDDRWGDR
jgi:ribose/xylose/arabinose/galactoside ABC-type transport system permease subunit